MTVSRRRVFGQISIILALVLIAVLGIRERQVDDARDEEPVPVATEVQFPEPATTLSSNLPEAELLSALAAACSEARRASGNNDWTQAENQARIAAFNELKVGLSERLSVSPAADHLHLAALLEDDAGVQIEWISHAISLTPADPFLLWRAVQVCSRPVSHTYCPLQDWEQRLISVDGQNSESWVRIAANRYAAGEHDAALQAMRHASTAAESRVYWTETIEMVERGLAAGSDYSFPERAELAFGFAASMLPGYGDHVNMCRERSSESVDWAHACLAYGELVEIQGRTEIGTSIALEIQKFALEALGEFGKAAQVEQRLQARRQERLDSVRNYSPAIEQLVFSNPNLFSTYLAAIRSEGEGAARRRIRAEIERLMERQSGLSCE